MSKYPRLKKMGVLHPQQIERFSISSVGYTDNLRLFYVRPRGSVLPVSRSYRFPRVQKLAVVNPDTGQTETVMESDPAFREAVKELQEITALKEHSQGIAAAIIEELGQLEEDIAMRSAVIKELAARIKVV